jgi:nucleotide-binding universal stress UspA family protein
LFRHILIPTDGSRLAAKAIKPGVKLAKALGAKVTGVYVVAPFIPAVYADAAVGYVPGITLAEYERAAKAQAKKALALLERAAAGARVRCATRIEEEMQPWRGILKAARKSRCDGIAMASHGRSGLGGAILGSQTARVLAHSKLPVLVLR